MEELESFISQILAGNFSVSLLIILVFGYWSAFISRNFYSIANRYGFLFYLLVMPQWVLFNAAMIGIAEQSVVATLFFLVGFYIRFFGVKS